MPDMGLLDVLKRLFRTEFTRKNGEQCVVLHGSSVIIDVGIRSDGDRTKYVERFYRVTSGKIDSKFSESVKMKNKNFRVYELTPRTNLAVVKVVERYAGIRDPILGRVWIVKLSKKAGEGRTKCVRLRF